MELQFQTNTVSCLRQVKGEVQSQEQTQELRLNDGMPDIGRVLGAWGQVAVRGKEWHSDGAVLNCGVMVWVLYAPEDGSAPQCVETWLPMSLKWDMADIQTDGTLLCCPLLRSVDARTLSSRKLMVRASVGAYGQCWLPHKASYYTPAEMPSGIQLRKKTYPMCFAREAGEKAFMLDEEMTLPESMPVMEKLIRFSLQPEVTEKKVLGDKAVFRGNGMLHILYRTPEGTFAGWDTELPFSQYTQLDEEYGHEGQIQVFPMVTSLELDAGEQGRLRLKAGLTGQYMIYDVNEVTVVDDAYSPDRTINIHTEDLELPTVLDRQSQRIRAEQTAVFGSSRIADSVFYPGCAQKQRKADGVALQLPGIFQVLYYDNDGVLQSGTTHWQGDISVPVADNAMLNALCEGAGKPQATAGEDSTVVRGEMMLSTVVTAAENLTAVTALTVGEETVKDPERPSLILRKAGTEELWDIAKNAGSTVEAICSVNNLQGTPDPDQMLLIPVL